MEMLKKRKKKAQLKAIMRVLAKVAAGTFAISALSAIAVVLGALVWSHKYDLTETDGNIF